ncbi:MAG: DNA mismatch repair protein MutS [Clostridia bacterium]|nr:DNA mismatch repair protein MutS [Clostridia bacterium]
MSPMMEQYFAIKNKYKNYLLFYRLGDFYELFFDDALTASRELELTLTGRDCGEAERAPMCGVPFHSADSYIAKLIEKGYKVAICEQMEDPATAKGLVKRDVIRIVTAGTVLEADMLNEKKNNYLASVCIAENAIGLSLADVSTGQVFATCFDGADRMQELKNELGTYSAAGGRVRRGAERVPGLAGVVRGRLDASVEDTRELYFLPGDAAGYAERQFGPVLTDADRQKGSLIASLGALLAYIEETQKTDISYIKDLNIYENGRYMQLDFSTRRNLELTETLRTKEKKGTLLWALDKTETAPGARMLRQWLEHPLLSLSKITRRQAAVGELVDMPTLREDVRELLSRCLDLERLITRVVYGSANARDLRAISTTLSVLPEIKRLLADCTSAELAEIRDGSDALDDIVSLIESGIVQDPPFSVREGGMIADGYSAEIDGLRSVVSGGKDWIENEAEKERERTGIKNLRIGYNRVFGYYIEVTNSFKDLVPETYIRKQTLSNAERYITEELKKVEATVLGAGDRLASAEYEAFCDIRSRVSDASERIQKTASLVARLDVYCSLAKVADAGGYVCPSMNDRRMIDIRDGRHPVVEKFVKNAGFVPNDTHLDMKSNRVMLITGPNMAGKSTYMRQVALIAVMTQIGSFVPAASADMCVLDRIFTRIGASDDLASGQSTFMLEMNEVAAILRSATKDSLIVYDEVGRGTSTFDGMSIARAILEYTHSRKVGAKTMFATHYHELTSMADEFEGIFNCNIAARKRGGDVIFLRKIVPGSTDDSYGIEVAKLAGVPSEVIKRAREILAEVEAKARLADQSVLPEKTEAADEEMNIGEFINDSIIDDIRAADLNNMSPFEAMNLLFDFQKRLK